MKDLTDGSIAKNILQMALPIVGDAHFARRRTPWIISRLITFIVPSLWFASSSHFQLVQLWYVSVASVTLQAVLSLWLVRREFRRRLTVAVATHA
jgi:Na+-driven multidrug efflux pump